MASFYKFHWNVKKKTGFTTHNYKVNQQDTYILFIFPFTILYHKEFNGANKLRIISQKDFILKGKKKYLFI